jgi:hypothetical protein
MFPVREDHRLSVDSAGPSPGAPENRGGPPEPVAEVAGPVGVSDDQRTDAQPASRIKDKSETHRAANPGRFGEKEHER